MNQEELKPCPFCGQVPTIEGVDRQEGVWAVICAYCDAEGPLGWDYDEKIYDDEGNELGAFHSLASSKDAAIKAWNTRK